jgi:hypothetical protein
MNTRHRRKRTSTKTKKKGGGFWSSIFGKKKPIASKPRTLPENMTFESPVNINSRFKASSTLLGKGGFGTVKLVNGRVVKKLAINEDEAYNNDVNRTKPESFAEELRLTAIASKDNPYVSTYEELPTKSNRAKYLLLETMGIVNNEGFSESGGELHKAIAKGKINESNTTEIIVELLKGLDSIHDRHILHLDIKPNNIWVFPDSKKIKYYDFGLSCLMNERGTCSRRLMGTPGYMKEKHEVEVTPKGKIALYDVTDDFYALAQTLKFLRGYIVEQVVAESENQRIHFMYNQYRRKGWKEFMLTNLITETNDAILIFLNMIIENLSKLTVDNKAIDAIPSQESYYAAVRETNNLTP